VVNNSLLLAIPTSAEWGQHLVMREMISQPLGLPVAVVVVVVEDTRAVRTGIKTNREEMMVKMRMFT